MPADTMVGRVSRGEFFAVLAPGFFMFVVAYAALNSTARALVPAPSLWKVLTDVSSDVQKLPALLIFILFAAYLFGSIVRALPVYYAERMIPPFTAHFPYPDRLHEVLSGLHAHRASAMIDTSRLPTLGDDVPMHVFNYWKDVLAIWSPEGFRYYETFEIRVRFFAGVLWAALSGILGSLYIIARSLDLLHPAGGPLLAVSVTLFVAFGCNFRRVRRQEGRALLIIFCALHQSCECRRADAKTTKSETTLKKGSNPYFCY